MLALLLGLILGNVSASPFRVLVFPHQGTYPIPQGRESEVSTLSISSDEVCNQYVAGLNSRGEWEKRDGLLASEKLFSLSSIDLRKKMNELGKSSFAFYFECTLPFKVNREAPLTSYSYEGDFVAIVDQSEKNNQLQIINLIESEKYIQGVVPSEVGNGWPTEALKAQAVAARTFAWWTVINERSSPGSNYDLDDTVQYQAYSGTANHSTATDEAVFKTAHQVMKYDGKVIKAYFSADSGGKTESSMNVFGQNLPYCISKEEQYDLSKTKTEWTVKYSMEEVGKILSLDMASLAVDASDINSSGRTDQVTISLKNGKTTTIAGPLFRKALKLRSTLFSIKTSVENMQEVIEITGKGYGHGVGMAQIGAKEYALQLGWTFDQIVKFYYTGITLESVTNEYYE